MLLYRQKRTIVITPQFESALDFKDGLAKVELTKSMYGYINKKGKIVYSVRVNK
ncbi:MAG: WG repeat-containing protein [Bacteroidales bacterium]|nr:WG repeat-containing protein [Bacteroidales bacterium]